MKWSYDDFAAGCIGGGLGVFVGHPLDTIKTWQQASNSNIGTACKQIIQRNNGLNGFYRGMFFPFVTAGAINSILFGVYGNHLRQLQKVCHSDFQREQLEYQNIFAAGSIAGFVQSFLACPIELIKVRLQTHHYYNSYVLGQRKTPFNCMREIVRNKGISGLYRGLLPMMCRDVLPYGIYMLAYQYTLKLFDEMEIVRDRRRFTTSDRMTNLEVVITTVAGALAGVMSWVLVIPFDVIKTIMQAEENAHYKSIRHCMQVNVKRYGWKSLFRGSWMLVVRAMPVNAATFLGYEYSLEWFRRLQAIDNENEHF